MTRIELLKKYLKDEKQKVHKASADYDHKIPIKGLEHDYEEAMIAVSLLEDMIAEAENQAA